MSANSKPASTGRHVALSAVRDTLRGAGQVMFQESAWTGLLFLAGIFWGSYECHVPQVAWGAVVGLIVSTVAGYLVDDRDGSGPQGLWGFNGILVGCAFPTFMADTWQMWLALVICAAATTWVRRGLNNVMGRWGVTSYTFPFVLLTWIFLLASRQFSALGPVDLSVPALTEAVPGAIDTSFGSLVIYWLKGIAQVFLVDSWVTGIFFLVALAVCSVRAAVWAGIGSAVALGTAFLFHGNTADIAAGLYGFSPVLTAIAVGATFYKSNYRSALWALVATVVTVFLQAGMNAFMAPLGIPTLTGPFCIATWLFMLEAYKFSGQKQHSQASVKK